MILIWFDASLFLLIIYLSLQIHCLKTLDAILPELHALRQNDKSIWDKPCGEHSSLPTDKQSQVVTLIK